MTLAEIRTAVRNLIKSQSSETGTLFPVDNVLLDFFINTAAKVVVLDLARGAPDKFLTYEDVSILVTSGGLSVLTVSAVGSGYTNGDQVLTIVQAGASGGKIKVTIAANALSTIDSIVTPGTVYSVATALATTGGGGTGAKVNITAIKPTAPRAALSSTWLKIWQVYVAATGAPIPIVPWTQEMIGRNYTRTAAAPEFCTIAGGYLYFYPVVTGDLTSYARVYYLASEAAAIAAAGPVWIPEIAQPCIPIQAAVQIAAMLEVDPTKWDGLYQSIMGKNIAMLGDQILFKPDDHGPEGEGISLK